MDRRKFFGASVLGAAGLVTSTQATASQENNPLKIYNNVQSMKNDLSLEHPDHVMTLGYYTPGDGGGAHYNITYSSMDTDQGSIIELDNGLHAFLRKTGTISVKQFGIMPNVPFEYSRIIDLEKFARNNRQNIYFPSGLYEEENGLRFPFYTKSNGRQLIEPAKDYSNITIFGDGKSTILKTKSDKGDVLNLNYIKNLTIRDLSITSNYDGESPSGNDENGFVDPTSGANGVSITGDCMNIEIRNVFAFNLGYAVKDGLRNKYNSKGEVIGTEYVRYIDGGKAFSVQFVKPQNLMKGIKFINCTALNCGYGFGVDTYFESFQDVCPDIFVDGMMSEQCYKGYVISGAEPEREIPQGGVDCGIRIFNSTALNCQQGVALSRCQRPKVNVRVRTTKSPNDLRHDIAYDNEIFGLSLHDTKYGNIEVDGLMYTTEKIYRFDGITTKCFLKLGIDAASSTQDYVKTGVFKNNKITTFMTLSSDMMEDNQVT